MGFPEGEGMINGAPKVTCDDPVRLQPSSQYELRYVSPTGQEVTFELTEFSGRTTWFPPMGESTIVVWISADEFFSYSVDPTNGQARWDDPLVYRRCI